ncbi:MAG: hypothetical protein E7022_04165 [Desulfovibrio desulfuricans]|nr:hypothetical protein [Desulfovibrio desulfuricans]
MKKIDNTKSNTDYDIAICPHMTLSGNDKTFNTGFFYKNHYNFHIFANTITPLHCCLFRRTVINRLEYFDISLSGLEDYDFMFRAALNNFRFISNHNTLAIYRHHENNSSLNIDWEDMCYTTAVKFDKLINDHINNYCFIDLYGLSSIYIVFASSIIGYAFKYKTISQQKESILLNMAIKYILLACSCNDIKDKSVNTVILYTCLIRIKAMQYTNNKYLSKALEQFKKIIPQAFAYEATQTTLKQLSSDNYIPPSDIISIFTPGVSHLRHLL